MCGAFCQGAGTKDLAALKKSTPFANKNSNILSKEVESEPTFCKIGNNLFISDSEKISDFNCSDFTSTLNLFASTELISPL